MFEIQKQDLLSINAAAICHQVNCQNVMGAGVAKAIAEKYPEVKREYHALCLKTKAAHTSPKVLLGTVQVVPVNSVSKAVVNIFGQQYYGRFGVYTDYDALAKAFTEINEMFAGKRIAFPYGFGCGLAGGDWMTVEKLMLKHLWGCDVVVCLKEGD